MLPAFCFFEPSLYLDARPESAAERAGRKVSLRRHEGYDHSYFFIASFMADHIAFHAARL